MKIHNLEIHKINIHTNKYILKKIQNQKCKTNKHIKYTICKLEKIKI